MDHPPVETGADDISAHPRHTGHRWFDLAMAIVAILISSVSLVVAIQHGQTERELVQAASWPFVQENTRVQDHAVSFSIVNSGIGPAKMRWLEVTYDGQPVRDVPSLLQRCCGVGGGTVRLADRVLASGNPNDQVMRAGDQLEILGFRSLGDPAAEAVVKTLSANLRRIGFRGCYCSVFDRCWIGDMTGLDTRAVRMCPVNPDKLSMQIP